MDDAMSDRLGRAQTRAVRGDRAGARALYEELWAEASRAGDRYWACVVAHFLAHTHVEPTAQLAWHRRALDAAAAAEAAGDTRVRAFYPSLHANLAEVYLRLADRPAARRHLALARVSASVLPDDANGASVHGLIARLRETLAHDGTPML